MSDTPLNPNATQPITTGNAQINGTNGGVTPPSTSPDVSTPNDANAPMPLITRMGVVMSMLGVKPKTTGLDTGSVDTTQMGLASSNTVNPTVAGDTEDDTGQGGGMSSTPGTATQAGAITTTQAKSGKWTQEQMNNAATIASVGHARGLSDRAIQIAIATAIQESTLHNYNGGDRDSEGLFQQRPSQGWGTPAQVTDPVYAANKFYDSLLKVPNWETIPLTQAAQSVQRSAYPNAYAPHEQQATDIMNALKGAS